MRHPLVMLISLPLLLGLGLSGLDAWRQRLLHHGCVLVQLKELGNFPLDKDHGILQDVPRDRRVFDGQRVIVSGFMYVGTSARSRVDQAQLVWQITRSHFRAPLVQERIFLRAHPGQKLTMYNYGTLVAVTGTLHVDVAHNSEGEIVSVFTMDVDSIVPTYGTNPPLLGIERPVSDGLAGTLLVGGCWALIRGIGAMRARAMPGRCRGCGYDLRATPWRCPECGREPTPRELRAAVLWE